MIKTVQRRTRDAFILVLLIPAVLGVATFWLEQVNDEGLRWVAHSQEVLRTVNRILASAYETESNQRGYLLTGDNSFLQRYQAHSLEESRELHRFIGLTSDNPVQQRHATEILNVWAQRSIRMQRILELRKAGRMTPEAASLLRQGRALMDQMSGIVSQMSSEESRLLGGRTRRQHVIEVILGWVFGVAVIINLALLYWAYTLIRNYGLARDAAESQILRAKTELERRVAERTAELQEANDNLTRSNQDLTRFAYVASHDLQEPLRTIGSYAGLLARRYEGKLDAQADKYINFIVSGAKRMQSMVQDLLMYSRTGTQQLTLRRVDLNHVLDVVQQNLRIAIGESGAQILREGLSTVEADESKLTMVFQNLISNALKFRHPDRQPVIRVSATRHDEDCVVQVKDNGIGFDPQYADRIFVIFQRLHQVGEYPGTGIGLAICRRILEGHGGRIWADSTPGEGSTFYFSIPVHAQRAVALQQEPATLQAQKG